MESKRRVSLQVGAESLLLAFGWIASSWAQEGDFCQRDWVEQGKEPPRVLSQSGIFKNLKQLDACEGILSYEVNSALWSDGAEKRRWVALPPGGKIQWRTEDPWVFPVGSLFVKHFELNLGDGKPIRLETRVSLIRPSSLWVGWTYRWNEDQTDAVLLVDGAQRDLGNGRRWAFPSQTQCLQCHNSWSGGVLGVRTEQLNRVSLDSPSEENQLARWAREGRFSEGLPSEKGLPKYVSMQDKKAPLHDRVRSYLAVNCAHCHQPGSVVRTTLDLRYKVSLDATHLVNEVPNAGDLDLDDPVIVRPGDRSSSILYLRMNSLSTRHMPAIGSLIQDQTAVDEIGSWIDQLPATKKE